MPTSQMFGKFEILKEQVERSRADIGKLREWLAENVSERYMADHWGPKRLPTEVADLVLGLERDIASLDSSIHDLHQEFVQKTAMNSILFVSRRQKDPSWGEHLDGVDFHLMLARIYDYDPGAVLPHCRTCSCTG